MTPLGRALADRIRRDGPITVADYMAACLTDPEHGYYRHAAAVGAAGDFVTAPEISQMFGELLGLWAAEIWSAIGRPNPIRLVELGPGRGTLMSDALRAAVKAAPDFRAAIELHLVEINPTLRLRQAAALAAARPRWHDRFDTVPEGPLIVLANEFVDAFPVRQFVKSPEGWRERCVGFDETAQRFVFVPGPRVDTPPVEPAHATAPDGAVVEVNSAGRALAAALAQRVTRHGGAALIIDYGAMASGTGDTLQAVRRHRKVNALEAPGECDLTAQVDFAALGRAAASAGAAVYGPVPQGIFLHRLGIAARAATLLRTAGIREARAIAAASERLIGDTGMGMLFKALALTPPGAPAPPGFDPAPSFSR